MGRCPGGRNVTQQDNIKLSVKRRTYASFVLGFVFLLSLDLFSFASAGRRCRRRRIAGGEGIFDRIIDLGIALSVGGLFSILVISLFGMFRHYYSSTNRHVPTRNPVGSAAARDFCR